MKTNPLFILTLGLSTSLLAQEPAAPGPTKTSEPLSQAARDKIAAMTPIFDGQTLNGWIQSPINFSLNAGDISQPGSLAKKISDKADPVSAYLAEQLDDAGKSAMAGLTSTDANAKAAISAFAKSLSKVVTGPLIYDAKRFANVHLSAGTEELLKTKPTGAELTHLNRLLLEDAYPAEIAKSMSTSWAVKDGAMASTGAGRGVIYTKDDYTNYRIVFELRQISGNPGHQPCVLMFLPGRWRARGDWMHWAGFNFRCRTAAIGIIGRALTKAALDSPI